MGVYKAGKCRCEAAGSRDRVSGGVCRVNWRPEVCIIKKRHSGSLSFRKEYVRSIPNEGNGGSSLPDQPAMDAHEKITIYGDYDVDGITATSILYLYLSKAGAEVDYYLPDRMTEGYGLNENAVRMLAETGTKLMVTVDTGISAVKECQLAKIIGDGCGYYGSS